MSGEPPKSEFEEQLSALRSQLTEIAGARKWLPSVYKQGAASLAASVERIAHLEAQGIKLSEVARSLQSSLQAHLTKLSAAGRSQFEEEFPKQCTDTGLLPLTGSIDGGYRVRGAIEVRPNFARGRVRVSTISETRTISPPVAGSTVTVVRTVYKRLYERPFQVSEFERRLLEAFARAGGRKGDSVPLASIHQQLFLLRQKVDFFRDMSSKRMIAYPVDEFSVDLGRFLAISPHSAKDRERVVLELGRDGIIIFKENGGFDSYKFLRVTA
jgi:hypothetical protein